jgi:HEAT repeat protein
MKRGLGLLVFVVALGLGGYFLWPYLFAPAPPKLAVNNSTASSANKNRSDLDPAVRRLMLEYDAHVSEQPSPASRRVMMELSQLGPKGPLPAPLIIAWLQRMHDASLGSSAEFRELAGVLRTIAPETPHQLVAAVNRQDVAGDLSYEVDVLVALGKIALPAVSSGLAAAEGNVREAASVLPVVLAKLGPTALPELRQAVAHPSPVVRRQAIRTLALLGPETAGSARPELEASLNDKDRTVRTLAALSLGELGHFAAEPPPALAAALQDSDPVVRLCAARSLARYATFDRQQIATALIDLLRNGDWLRAAWSMGLPQDQQRPYAESKGGLHYWPMYWEETAADLLIELGPQHQLAPPVLLRMLQECPHDGRHIVHMLVVQGEGAQIVVPELAAMVKDKDSRQRRKALLALGRLLAGRAGQAVPEIQAALKHSDGRTRWRALATLALLDVKSVSQSLPVPLHPAIDAAAASAGHPQLDKVDKWTRCQWQYHPLILLPATSEGADAFKRFEPWTLSDEEVWLEKGRAEAMLAAVDKAGPGTSGAAGVDLLLTAWQTYSRTPSDRKQLGDKALDLLAREGAAAQSAVPLLIYALSWYEMPVLAKAFVKIGDAAVPELAKALDNVDIQDLWPSVLMVLQQFGPKAEPAVPAVVKLLSARDQSLGQLAAATLGTAGAGAKEAVHELKRLLTNPSNDTRRHAADALGLIGPQAETALPDLVALFKDDNQQLRVVAVRAVARIGKDAVPSLIVALSDPNDKVRLSAVEALTRLQGDAAPALAALKKLDRDGESPAVRTAARELVKNLEAK